MPTDFASYDLNQDGMIGQDEWSQFYAQGQGPMTAEAGGVAPAPFDLDTFLARIGSGNFTDDDLLGFQNYLIATQLGNEGQQLDLEGRKLDLQGRQVDMQGRELDLSGQKLGFDEAQLEQQYREFEFQRDQYFPWYTGDFFDFQKQQEANKVTMSNNQVTLSELENARAKEYALAQRFNTEAAGYGAQQARYQYLRDTGLGGGGFVPSQVVKPLSY